MADLVARESMKELDRKIANARPKSRASYLALDGTGHFKFIEQDRAYCELWSKALDQEDSRELVTQYRQWLSDTNRIQKGRPHDTTTNRLLFFAWFENKEALLSKVKKPA
jgi:hypothetical protein